VASDNLGLAHDTATAAAASLVETFWWCLPDDAQAEHGRVAYEIVLAAVTYALAEQRAELLHPSTN
jgi:hypothetical protein